MEFGIYHEFPSLTGRPDSDAFREAFAIVDAAEEYGLDVMWLAELHFDPPRSVLSSPMVVAAAIGARTKRIKIGTSVQVLPLSNPLRLAEEAATLDHICHGRLIYGVGRSGVAKTYEAYNVPYAESRDRFTEALEIIARAWAEPSFSHTGKHYQFTDVAVTPRPLQAGGPPIRVAATSADTFTTIGAQGRPIFLAVRHEDARDFAPNIAAYRQAWRDAGHAGSGQVYLRTPGYIAATQAQARAEAEASLIHYYRSQGVLLADSARRAGVDASDRRLKTAERLMNISYDEAIHGSLMIGTPDTITERLRGLQNDLALDGVLIELNCGGKVEHGHELEALRLLGTEVMPGFR